MGSRYRLLARFEEGACWESYRGAAGSRPVLMRLFSPKASDRAHAEGLAELSAKTRALEEPRALSCDEVGFVGDRLAVDSARHACPARPAAGAEALQAPRFQNAFPPKAKPAGRPSELRWQFCHVAELPLKPAATYLGAFAWLEDVPREDSKRRRSGRRPLFERAAGPERSWVLELTGY